MTLRFRSRHVHKALADHLEAELASLGWVSPPTNFGTVPIVFLEFQPDEAGVQIVPNTVSITLGDEPADSELELGAAHGGLWSTEYPLFVDVYRANHSIATSIASDVKDILGDLSLEVRDYTADATGVAIEEHLVVDRDTVSVERPLSSVGSVDLRLLVEQRKRLVAAILGHAERTFWSRLSREPGGEDPGAYAGGRCLPERAASTSADFHHSGEIVKRSDDDVPANGDGVLVGTMVVRQLSEWVDHVAVVAQVVTEALNVELDPSTFVRCIDEVGELPLTFSRDPGASPDFLRPRPDHMNKDAF